MTIEELEERYRLICEHDNDPDWDTWSKDMMAALKESQANQKLLPEKYTSLAAKWAVRNERLRAAVEKAPHHINCPCAAAYVKENCICWKRKALELQ